ncbi:tetratricopeptide repeat protein [Polymorphospora rubra]|uniref:SARP family transcriptional regulator n=1 Tax=Polymorphospora rubra TaxID=338584 RepID=A0A810N570_9ACTN|nr:SARP family transcriptional regulator [Polymorphospora rubra]
MRLWRGEPLAELHTGPAEHLRREMQEKLLGAHRLLIESELVIGRPHVALTRLEPLMSAHPLDESLARLWVAALHAVGREHEAESFVTGFTARYRKQMRGLPAPDLTGTSVAGRRTGVVHDDVRRPRAAGSAPPRQVPRGVPDFVGHEDVLAELDRVVSGGVERPGAVVLTGMPGVGKTTLAVHWARRQQDGFPDGQLFLNAEGHGALPPVRPEEGLRHFLAALGVPTDQMPADPAQRLARYNEELAGRRVLVVVDNVRDSEQVRPLIPMTDTCLVVITSRVRLKGLTIREGVQTITVPPLPEAQQTGLLARIVRSTRGEVQPALVESLARLSGGLPLALRIIGEHVAARPRAAITDLVEELANRLLDCDGDETDDASLRTVFAWSYQALAPEAARLFRHLGLFPGATIDAAAAGALIDRERTGAERALNTLARAHLINHDDARRYRLHDLIHKYAVERAHHDVPHDERGLAVRRLLDWYLLTAANAAKVLAPDYPPVPGLPEPGPVRPLSFPVDRDAMKWCEAERANLYASVRLAAEHALHRRAWQLPNAIHGIFDRFGRQDDTLAALYLALDAATTDGHDLGRAGTLINLGATYFALHDHRRAAEFFEQGLRVARAGGIVEAQMACLHNLAYLHHMAGEVALVLQIYDEILATCRAIGSVVGQATVLAHLGDAHWESGSYERATAAYLEALAVWEQAGSTRGQAHVHVRLAALHLEQGRPVTALDHCQSALDIYRHTTDEASRCRALVTAADARRQIGELSSALRDASAAVAIGDEIGDPLCRASALCVLADIQLAAGHRQTAYTGCLEAQIILGDNASREAVALRQRLYAIAAGVSERGP